MGNRGFANRDGAPRRAPTRANRCLAYGCRGAVAFFVAFTLLAAPAWAGEEIKPCSKLVLAPPLKDLGPGPAPLVIGDSVAGFSVFELQQAGFRLNGQGCRTFKLGLETLRKIKRKRGDKLPAFIVMELGTVGAVTPKQISRAKTIIGPERVLGLVTPRKFFSGDDLPAGALMRTMAARAPGRVALFDWQQLSFGQDDWFYPDLVHPNERGAYEFATLLAGYFA